MTDLSATFADWLKPRSASPLDRLVLFFWRNELLLICACMRLYTAPHILRSTS
jgi:hypothetical protein